MSIAHARPRLVHRHGRLTVAGDAGAVAERRVERLAEQMPTSSTVWWAPVSQIAADARRRGRGARGGRAGRACGRRSRRRWRASPAPVPSSVERQAHLGLGCRALDRRLCGSSAPDSRERAPPSTRRAARSPRRGRAARRPRPARRPPGRSAPRRIGGGSGAARAPRRSERRRWSAGRGWSRRCSRRTRSRCDAHEQAAGRRDSPARAPRPPPRSAAGARARTRWRARAACATLGDLDQPRTPPRRPSGARGPALRVSRRARRRRRGGRDRDDERCPSPCSACASRSSATSASSAVAVCAERDQQVARAGEPVDADLAEHLPLGLLHVQVAGTDDHVDAVDRLGAVGQRGDRLGAAHPVDDAPRRTAGRRRGRPGRPLRRSPGGAHTATSSRRQPRGDDAHHDRARVGRPPAGNVDRGRADGHLAQDDALPLRQLDGGSSADAGVGHDARRSRSPPRSPATQLGGESRDRRRRAPRRDAQRPRLVAGRCRTGACSRATASSPSARTRAMISRTCSATDAPSATSERSGRRRPRARRAAPRRARSTLDPHSGARASAAIGSRPRSSAVRSSSSSIAAAFSLCATGLAISRAVQTAISSRTTRLFSRSVVPVAVRSTIASTRPVSGASSTDPLTSTISACRPVSSRWRAAIRGYLVAIRITPRRRSASSAGSATGLARQHHRAAAVAEVDQLVDLALPFGCRLLHQHVLAGDAEVGGAGLHVGGHVGGAHRDDADVLEQQLAVVLAHLARCRARAGRAGRAFRRTARREGRRS